MDKEMKEEIKEIRTAEYMIKAIPIDNKNWAETGKIEVAFTLETLTDRKTFKGTLDLFGIVKK